MFLSVLEHSNDKWLALCVARLNMGGERWAANTTEACVTACAGHPRCCVTRLTTLLSFGHALTLANRNPLDSCVMSQSLRYASR